MRARLLQGGGLKLRHLVVILPENLAILRGIFGDLGLALIAIGGLAAVRRPLVFAFTVPYAVTATLFFSLWTRAEPRYLAGVVLMGVLLLVHGCTVIAGASARRGVRGIATAVAAGMAVLLLGTWTLGAGESALPLVTAALRWSIVAAVIAAVVRGLRPAERTIATALMLSLMGVLVWRSTESIGFHARFQRAEVERAQRSLGALLDPNALVLTRSDIGRPAENINYYTDTIAVYEQELQRWDIEGIHLMNSALRRGFAVYFLMPPQEIARWRSNARFRTWFEAELVARIPPQQAVDYFVASPSHRGVPLDLFRVRLKPEHTG